SIGVLRIVTSALPTFTALSASPSSATVGQPVTFTATVTDLFPGGPVPSRGTVTFSDQDGALGSEPLVDGVATFTTSGLPAGPNTVTASYGGTTGFAPSSASTTVTVTVGAAGSVVQWSTASGGNGHYYELVMPADPSEDYSWRRRRPPPG